MEDNQGNRAGVPRSDHLIRSIDTLLESGQVTAEEAAALKARVRAGDHDEVVVAIRVRHADAALSAAVSDGSITREEADDYLRRIRAGEHSSSLRSDLRGLRQRPRRL
jgi:hypothetical protein